MAMPMHAHSPGRSDVVIATACLSLTPAGAYTHRWCARPRQRVENLPQCEWRIPVEQLGAWLSAGCRGHLYSPGVYQSGYVWNINLSRSRSGTLRASIWVRGWGYHFPPYTPHPTAYALPPLVSYAATLSCTSGEGIERTLSPEARRSGWGWDDFFKVGEVTEVGQLQRFMSDGALVLKAALSCID